MKSVVFLGDFNVDLIMDGLEGAPEPDHEVRCSSFDIVMGSSSCIAAAAYARLGGGAAICGLSGDDEFAAFMRARLAEAGVSTALAVRDAREKTGVTVNLVQGAGRGQVTFPGAMDVFGAAHVPPRAFEDMRHLHVSGVYQARSLLPDVGEILARAAGAGATTSLDCQWDPTQRWQDLDAWLSRVDWLFANEQEARSVTGAAGAAEAARLLASRTKSPVVKAGSDGALIVDGGEVRRIPGFPVRVVDTIGAGDNFDAGFLYAVIEKGMALSDAAAFANAAAARSCAFRGGTDARSSYRDVLDFIETTETTG
jgi:sugar/nucleoside kinase (ribokinase family)